MERFDRDHARDNRNDVAAARIVRAATVRLGLALALASFTATLGVAALAARAERVAAAPPRVEAAPPAVVTSATVATSAAVAADPAADDAAAPAALRTDI